MMQCQTPGCNGLSGAICTGAGQWIQFCPICKTKQAIQPPRQPDAADGLAAHALVYLQRCNYAAAEQSFLAAAGKVAQDGQRQAFYLWCSLIARYGVEYVHEILYPNIPARRANLFVPTFGRFPLPDHRITETQACRQLDMLLLGMPGVEVESHLNELDILLQKIEQCMHNEQNNFDIFIAWHDRLDNSNGPCRTFADRLNSSLNAYRDCYSFVSFRSLHNVTVDRYEPHIYTALASAKVMAIVIDDYDALGKKFLASEIKRFSSRQLQDQNLQIYFCGMKDHVGRLPAHMANWQLHQQQCENEDVWVNLVTNEVMDVLRWSREHAKPEPKPVPEPAPAPSPRPAEKKPPVLHKTALIALLIAAVLLLAVLLTGSSSTDQNGNSPSGEVTNASDQNVPNHQGAAGDNGSSTVISTDTNTSAGSSGSGLPVSQSDDISSQSTGGIQQEPPKLAGYGTVNTDSIYMRRNPWREDNNVARHIAHAGTSVYVYELVTNKDEDWYKVSYDGVEGYIPARYVDINNSYTIRKVSTHSNANQRLPGYGTVNTDSIYIRRNPWRADNNVAIRVAHAGTSVYVYELVTNKNEDWYKVSYNGVEGYVLAQYVDLN